MKYFFDRNYCKIYYDEDSAAVVIKWQGYAESEQFRKACDQSLELLKKMQTKFMIADNSEGKAVTIDDQNWLVENWFPRAFDEGYRVSAVITTTDIFRDMGIKNIVSQLDMTKFIIEYFNTYLDAQNWIKGLK